MTALADSIKRCLRLAAAAERSIGSTCWPALEERADIQARKVKTAEEGR